MIREAIILAGGLGTRLRSAVPDLPKCMAPVAGHPFLHYLIRYYAHRGIDRFIFSLGYRHETIEAFLEQELAGIPHVSYATSVEHEPLGTGGAVKKAAALVHAGSALVLNGDTFFETDPAAVADLLAAKNADCVLTLKLMKESERYGVVETDREQKIVSFREKQYYARGNINGGVYALNVPSFLQTPLPEKCSFEKDYLEACCAEKQFYGLVQEGYFIDIGIPTDFQQANIDLINFSV